MNRCKQWSLLTLAFQVLETNKKITSKKISTTSKEGQFLYGKEMSMTSFDLQVWELLCTKVKVYNSSIIIKLVKKNIGLG